MRIITINDKKINKTVKKFIMDELNLSSSKVSKMIDKGDVKVNNKHIKFNYLLSYKDEIKIYSLKTKKVNTTFLESTINLDLFYEDNNILIINKKRGLLCQEDATEKINTINNAIKKYLYLKKEWNPYSSEFIPNLCHRLDKYTSGLIIAAKNIETQQEINLALSKREIINKIYECLVYGIPKNKNQTLKNYIMELNGRMVIDVDNKFNKEIITIYNVVETYNKFSKLSVQIKTGKKHQIRVHLASIGHPLLGDRKYNNIDLFGYKYPCLVAKEIKFNFDKKSKLNYLNKKKFILKDYSYI